MAGIGEIAGFGTAVTWGISNQMQSAVGMKLGSTGVTLMRMPYQIFFIGLFCIFFQAKTFITLEGFALLALSGILGVFLCDFFLYWSIAIIGPSTAVLILSSGTIFTTLFGWIFLNETLPFQVILGIGITLSGILCVITEHSGSTLLPGQEIPQGKKLYFGILLAALGALMLSASFILLKAGLRTGVDSLWGTFVRVLSGAVVLWTVGAMRGWIKTTIRNGKKYPKVFLMLLFSCSAGATGIWFSTVAIEKAPVGVAATLIGLQPIMVTIIGAIWYRKKPSLRIVAGSLVAFAGIAMICLR